MTRGNQRDLARAKAQKKLADKEKSQKQGDYSKRKETDAEIMRQKQAAALAKKEGGSGQAEK